MVAKIFQNVNRPLRSFCATIPNACMQAVDAISTMTAEITAMKQTVVSGPLWIHIANFTNDTTILIHVRNR